MNWLISADLHFSDRPRDAYRFGLFKWLAEQQKLHKVDATFLLGDITQEKDKHSASLVNRVVDEIMELRPPVEIVEAIMMASSPDNPFFKFLNSIEGISFAVGPTLIHGMNVYLIPHCRCQKELDDACAQGQERYYVMCHQTFEGAIAETGARLTGLSAKPIKAMKPLGVWAGDVHRPQTLGPVTYVGAPYNVRFGDDFTPRVLLIKDGVSHDLHFPAPRKHAVRITAPDDLHSFNLHRGDQVKITVELPREEVVNWLKHRRMILDVAKEMGVEVHGIELKVDSIALPKVGKGTPKLDNTELLKAFCKAEKVPSAIRDAGLALIGTDDEMDRRA